jgi:adenylate cyclase
MAIEIERKFLINSDLLRQSGDLTCAKRYHIRQAYLSQGGHSSVPANTVRVRIVEAQAFLTIKGPATGITRAEFEYPIPVTDAEQLLTLCSGHVISKTRYLLPLAGHLWEVDEFHVLQQTAVAGTGGLPGPALPQLFAGAIGAGMTCCSLQI